MPDSREVVEAHLRVEIQGQVTVVDQEGTVIEDDCAAEHITELGLFLYTDSKLAVGDRISVDVVIDEGELFRATGTVVRAEANTPLPGVAIALSEISTDDARLLSKTLADRSAALEEP